MYSTWRSYVEMPIYVEIKVSEKDRTFKTYLVTRYF